MIKPDLIIRSYRKSLSITISKKGEVVVRAPKKLNMDYIMNFVREKEKWISRKVQEVKQKNEINYDVLNYKKFYFMGKLYKRGELKGIKKVELNNNNILFPKCDDIKILSYAQDWYINATKEILKTRVPYFAKIMHLNYNSISIMNNKCRWGSCSKDGDLKFNFRIAMLSHKLIDYIIIHELAHLIEFNHSKNFYTIIASVMSKWQGARKELKEKGYLLDIIR